MSHPLKECKTRILCLSLRQSLKSVLLSVCLMLCFLLFLWLDHCYLLLLLACRTNQWDFVLSCHCMANLHLCIFVCLRTDGFDWRGQRVSVGLAPADREDVHGLDIHDALWQRLRHTWRWADSGRKAGVRELSHIYKLLFFFSTPSSLWDTAGVPDT